MSFSGKVKEELAGQLSLARHCQVAELAALLCGCGRVEKMSDGNRKLWIQTENEAVARKSFTLLRKTFNIETAIVIREGSHLKRGKVLRILPEQRKYCRGQSFLWITKPVYLKWIIRLWFR